MTTTAIYYIFQMVISSSTCLPLDFLHHWRILRALRQLFQSHIAFRLALQATGAVSHRERLFCYCLH